MITHHDGAQLFSAWILIVQIASKCTPRGTLIRDGGRPHTPLSLSLKTRAPVEWFELALDYLEHSTDWLEVKEVAGDRQPPVSVPSPNCQRSAEGMEWNGRNGIERIEGKRENFSDGGMIGEVDRFFVEMGTLFNRSSKQAVSHLDQLAAVTICKRVDISDEITLIKQFKLTAEYFPQSLTSLLEKWDSTVDRARNHTKPNKTADKHDRKENLKINPL